MKRALLVAGCLAALSGTFACGASPASGGSAAAPQPPPGAVRVRLVDYMIEPAQIHAAAGTVVFYVTDAGQSPHNFYIRQPAGALGSGTRIVAHSRDLKPGESTILTAKLASGTYTFYCAFAGHEELGMTGQLTIG